MIPSFFDWLTNQPTKKSSFSSESQSAIVPSNIFSNKPKSMPSIEIDPSQIEDALKEHFNAESSPCMSAQNLQEALAIASHSPSLLSDSQRGSAILSLIGEEDAVFLVRLLRWKNGITCPFCGSKEVRKLPLYHARQYQCLQCNGGDFHGEFDDLTGYFPKGDFHSARIWVLINYLKMFMPLSKIAKILGISLEQSLRIVSMMQPEALVDKKRGTAKIVLKKKE